MPPRIPDQITVGTLKFRVFKLGDGRVAFDYKTGSRRVVVKRRQIEDLRAEAKRVAVGILNAETAALDLTAEQRRIAAAALAATQAMNLPLDALARDCAEAWKITNGQMSITDLARFWKRAGAEAVQCPPAADVLAALVLRLQDDRRAGKYIHGLRRDLARFVAACPDLALVGEEDIRAYLRALKTRTGQPVSDRRRDNIRDAIVTLFAFARSRGFLPKDRQTAAELVPRIKPGVEVATYSPEQLAHLLEHVSDRWRPWLVIAAFAGLRTSEIFRLDWSAFKWDQKDSAGNPRPVIAVRRTVAKKVRVARLVPIAENLLAWLAPWRDAIGPLYPHRANKSTPGFGPTWSTLEDQHAIEIERLYTKTGIAWEANALRHSYGSHRLALVRDYAAVAFEMGNSPGMIRKHYEDPKPEDEARRYFALVPPREAANVLPLEFVA
jgi:integrase